MLMAKTNRSYGGVGEAWLSDVERRELGTRKVRKWKACDTNYRIAPRKDIGPAVWRTGEFWSSATSVIARTSFIEAIYFAISCWFSM